MSSVPRHFDVRRLLDALQQRVSTLERGQRSTAALAERVELLELRVTALENGEPPPDAP